MKEDPSYFSSFSGYNDELMWGAIWLYKATNDTTYLNKAKGFYDGSNPKFFSWDDKKAGAYVRYFFHILASKHSVIRII